MRRLSRSTTLALAAGLAVLVLGALLLRPSQPAPARASDGRIVIRLTDFRLAPQRVRAQAGALTFELVDAGRLPHAFRLLRSGREVAIQRTLRPGAHGSFTRTVRPGVYRMLCPLSNHAELGMYGTVEVVK